MIDQGGFVVPVSWEALIDAGLGTPHMLAWDAKRDRERKERWRALPRRTRFLRRHFWPRWYDAKHRLEHAAHALRGIDCESDY